MPVINKKSGIIRNENYHKIYNSKWYEENKEKYLESLREKKQCEKCGTSVNIVNMARHKRTIKCTLKTEFN